MAPAVIRTIEPHDPGRRVRLRVEVLPCPADANAGGTVDINDIFTFLNQWFGGC